jgi:hypothetical protein
MELCELHGLTNPNEMLFFVINMSEVLRLVKRERYERLSS